MFMFRALSGKLHGVCRVAYEVYEAICEGNTAAVSQGFDGRMESPELE